MSGFEESNTAGCRNVIFGLQKSLRNIPVIFGAYPRIKDTTGIWSCFCSDITDAMHPGCAILEVRSEDVILQLQKYLYR